jgi:hypothetical protein
MTYNGHTADQISEYLSSFKYVDVASGSSDSITVELSDYDRKWMNAWFPQKGDRLQPVINRLNWDEDGKTTTLKCGTFIIDDFSFKGGPPKCTINALALPSTSGFKATSRTNTYENTTLKEIGQEVASRAGLTLYYDADSISIESVAQDNQTDCTFYSDLLTKFGLALKIYNDRLVVFDEGAYEAKAQVATLTEADFETGWSWNTTLVGTYTGVNYSYTHTTKDATFTVNIGGGDRILTCDTEANNQTEATIIALAALNNANKGTTTMKVTLRTPAWNIVATDCIKIKGMGQLSGKYYVEEVDTTVGDGTKSALSLRKVEERFTKSGKSTKVADSVAEAANSTTAFKVGDKVRVTQGATSYTGGSLASFVYTTEYTVIQVSGSGSGSDRVVIGINGAVTAAVAASNLYLA